MRLKKLASLYDGYLLLRLEHELEYERIPYWVKNEQVQALFGSLHYPNSALGPYEIWVAERDYERARESIECYFREAYKEEGMRYCPACSRELQGNETECPRCEIFLR